MNLTSIITIYRKEMLELTRDRRTMISMVMVPLAVIPLLFLVMNHFITSRDKTAETEAMKVAVRAGVKTAGLMESLRSAGFEIVNREDLRQAVVKKDVPAAVEESETATGEPEIQILEDKTRPASEMAGDKLRIALDGLKAEKVRAALNGSGISEKVLTPFVIRKTNVAPAKKMAGFAFGRMIGYMVILLMFSGAMYPAIDMTAGEKERRTLEILLASPASREEIVLGKIMAATTAAFITALLTISSTVYSFRFLPGSGKMKEVFLGGVPLDPKVIGLVLLAILPTAIVAASIMLAISSFAKSFKEGQSYLTPLIMLVIFPAVIGMLPGVELNAWMALIPVFNVSQLIKEIFLGEYSVTAFVVTFGSNLVYAAIAFYVAVRVFKSEGVLFRV